MPERSQSPEPLRTSYSCQLGKHARCRLEQCRCACHRQLPLFGDRIYAARALEAYFRESSYAHAANLASLA